MDDFTEGLGVEALLAPIEGGSPVGVDLRLNASPRSLYYRLRDARIEARQVEREMEKPKNLEDEGSRGYEGLGAAWPIQHWRQVRDLAIEALKSTKDLEVAAWLAEALVRGGALAGLLEGVELLTGLVERYWEDLYPLPDDEGVSTRVAPVSGLNGRDGNGTLVQPLRRLALFIRPDGSAFEYWQYEQSQKIAEAADAEKRQQRIDAGAIPFDTLYDEAMKAGGAHFQKLHETAATCLNAWRRFEGALDARAGADAPSTGAVRDMLEKVARIAKFLADKAPNAKLAAPPKEAAPVDPAVAPASAAPPIESIAAREDALIGLLHIAEYFRRTEPLSPLAYTLQEAVRRARMTWPELLEEIVPDPSTRFGILATLGIRPPTE